MKQILNIVLLSAGILLSMTGCQKGTEINNDSDNLVRFSAVTGTETRTAYSGVIKNGRERIDWSAGDQIMVWSDNATVRAGGTLKFAQHDNLAVYTIGSISEPTDERSIATISDPSGSGLQYPATNPGTVLWGIYPASAVEEYPTGNAVPFKIEASQALTQNSSTKAYAPDMSQAVMVAYVSNAKAGTTVDLPFTPSFTDFEFNLGIPQDEEAAAAYSVTITKVEFNSTSTALSGGFTATCGTDGKWTYTFADNAAKTVEATFDDGITLDSENPNLTFNVFALPQNITDLKVTFYTNEGTKTLKLLDTDKTTWLTFAGAKKHKLNGVILPTGWFFDYITLDLQVLKWEAVDVEGAAAEFPQATQMVVSGVGVKNGDSDLHLGGTGDNRQKDPYRQMWFFKTGQTVEIWFKVMLPSEGTWQLVPKGGTYLNGPIDGDEAYFNIKNVSPDATSATALTGPIRKGGATDVKFEITYKGTDSAKHCLYFQTYVIDKNGHRYCIDSETQLYDRGRGYHSFIVNSTDYPQD